MPFWVYVLQSESTGKIYIGHTSDLERRFREHNDSSLGRHRYTRKQIGPWHLVYSEEYSSRVEATKREKALKSGQGRRWIYERILSVKLNRQSPPEADSGSHKQA